MMIYSTEAWMRAQQQALPRPYDGYGYTLRPMREMTNGDLGLPLGQWATEWLESIYGRRPRVNAAYCFWLGKDGDTRGDSEHP